MLKKSAALIIVTIVLLLNLCACEAPTMGRTFKDSDDKIALKMLEKAIDAIETHDKMALKKMFSKQALTEADNLDENMDYLFELFHGKVEPIDETVGPAVFETIDHGHITKEFQVWHNVHTDEQEYIFVLIFYTENTDQPDHVGLYSLRVIKSEDQETQFGYMDDMKIPGIYKPAS